MNNPELNSSADRFPSFEDIEKAYSELAEYNDDHTGIGAIVRRVVKPMVEGDEIVSEELKDGEDSDLALDITSLTAGPIFTSIGVNRYETQRKDEIGKGDGVPGRQGLYVEEPGLFKEFIEARSVEFKNNAFISDMVVEIYQNMLKDIENIKGGERDAVLGDLEDVTEILKGVEFVNKKPNLELGQAFVNWGKKPEFEDFLIKRKIGLREKDSNSASEWHINSTSKVFLDRWHGLLDYYQKLSEKYGEDNELVLLMKMEIQETLSEVEAWFNGSGKDNKDLPANLEEAYEQVSAHAKYLHL